MAHLRLTAQQIQMKKKINKTQNRNILQKVSKQRIVGKGCQIFNHPAHTYNYLVLNFNDISFSFVFYVIITTIIEK